MPTAHPDFPRFFQALADPARFAAWQGDVVRQAAPRWMSRPYRFTGAGSLLTGARWSVKSLMPTVYASEDPTTLAAEVNYKWKRYGWTAAQFNVQSVVAMRWELQAVVDLTAAATLQALNVTKQQIVSCDWETEQTAGREALTQAIARAAFERLAEGLIVPSARYESGVNVVYYPGHRRDGTVIQTPHEAQIAFVHGL